MWRATDLLLERAVAVKVLRPEYSDHPETLDRFRKEARNAGALSNPHVAQVYDYGLSGPNGSPYLVMEYVDGPSLADILAVDPIDPVRALDVIAQAAEGLAAAHKAGVIHRDIKPGNILISSEGRVKVTDFGIAHAAGQAPVTGPGLVMGTTQYMAPERIAGNPGSAASDLYALGIVLHECLTGVPPHDGTAAEVMAAHLYLPLPPLPADVPPEFDHLVARLTAKDPAKRISDARELADLAARLCDALGGTLVQPGRTGGHSGSSAAVAAFAAESAPAMSGGSGPARLASPADGNRQSGPGRSRADSTALLGSGGYADSMALDSGGNTAVMPSPSDPGGPGYASDEWNVPARMSLPTRPSRAGQPEQPEQPRRRARTFAVGAAVVASAGLVALLVSGALNSTSAANQRPAGPSTTPTLTRVPSPGASARTSGPASGGIVPGGATTGAPGTATKRAGKTASASPSGHPSTGSPASPTASGSASSTPTGGTPSGSPSGSQPTSPSGAPSTPPSGAPTPSPTSSSCLLGICF